MSNKVARLINNCLFFAQKHLPQPCLLCQTRVKGHALCTGCLSDLPTLAAEHCPQCALPSHANEVCGNCLRHPPSYDHTISAYTYAFPLDTLVRRCKYQGALDITEFFARQLAQSLPTMPAIDLLIPMPLHPARLAERGFNQSTEITRRLVRHISLPWENDVCTRTRNTPPQAGQDIKARKRNLRGAFQCHANLSGMRIALIDDVMTTGASLDELAKTVKQAGATWVENWVIARTL